MILNVEIESWKFVIEKKMYPLMIWDHLSQKTVCVSRIWNMTCRFMCPCRLLGTLIILLSLVNVHKMVVVLVMSINDFY